MASNQKEVKVKVATEEELSGVEALELRINRLEKQKIQIGIDIASQKLEETQTKIEELKKEKANLEVGVDDSKIKEIESEIMRLEQDSLDLELKVESGELQKAKAEAEDLDGTTIDVDVNNIKAMEAVDQIGQGFDRLKQGASEVGQQFGGLLESAGRMEQTEAFLSMNMGADKAKQTLEDIRSVTDTLPGDDVTLQNLLSQAAMKDASMTTEAFNQMGTAAADYMAAMQNFGKTSTETQQDLMNYILAGNTAEIERSPILQAHVDKLKEGATVQERAQLLQEALTAEGWHGISNQDIYNNKLQSFNDMLERGKMNLGDVFLKGSEGAMDFIMKLDESTNGLVGMGVALAGFASPLTDTLMGLGQMATGIKAIGDLAPFGKIGDALGGVKTKVLGLASTIKTSLMGAFTSLKTTMTSTIIPALRNVATSLFNTGRAALTAGLNALKSAGMWLIEKAALVVTRGATLLMEAAQWLLNIAMNANPIMLIVTAILILIMVLGYLYFNNEQVRAAIDGLGQAFMQIGQIIYDSVVNAIDWLMTTLQNLWNYIVTLGGLLPENVSITGNRIVDTILRVLGFIATLPIQLGIILINTIAKVLGFGDNFVQNMIKAGSRAVTNFFSYIAQIPGRLATELGNALNKVQEWAASLPQKFWEAGVNAVKNFLAALGIASPGTMQRMLVWEITEMGNRVPVESRKLLSNVSDLGSNIVDSFGEPSLGLNYEDTMNSKLEAFTNTNDKTSGDIIFNHYGDMDTDERMNKFVDAVIRRLSFENTTAGRTV